MNRLNYVLKEARRERKENKLREKWRSNPQNITCLNMLIHACEWYVEHRNEYLDEDRNITDITVQYGLEDTVSTIYNYIPYYAVTNRELILIMRANFILDDELDYEISSFFKFHKI